MSEELAVREQEPLTRIEGFSDDELYIKPTIVEITQKMSKNGTFLKFWDVKQETTLDYIEAVPLRVTNKRALFEKGGEIGAPPLCRSNDGIVPSPFVKYRQAATCGNCPQSKWNEKQAPNCNEIKELLFMDRENGVPRKMNFSKMQLSGFKKFMEALKETLIKNKRVHDREVAELVTGGMNKAQAEQEAPTSMINVYDIKFKMTLEEKKTPKGNISIVKFGAPQVLKTLGEFRDDYIRYVVSADARRAQQAEEAALGVQEAEVDSAVSEVIDAEEVFTP